MSWNDHEAHVKGWAAIRAAQQSIWTNLLVPLQQQLIEDGWAKGYLQLPPLGWCRRDPWYVGDLR